MANEQPNNPLHGVTLKALLTGLVEEHGWEYLAERVRVQCFSNNPSIKSSLKFLRKTPWAREKVEALYLADFKTRERKRKRNLRRAARRAYAASVADGTAQTFDRAETAPTEVPPAPLLADEPVEAKTVSPPAPEEAEPAQPAPEAPSGWTFNRG